jgi:methionyl-tRNA formyltransferase
VEKIVMLVGDTDTSRIMYNALKNKFNIIQIIQEKPESTRKFIQRRIQRLGLATVIGQIAFILFNKQISKKSLPRIAEIKQTANLNDCEYDREIFLEVESVNSKLVIKKLKELNPDAIVVNGTRIISAKVLNAINAPFINTHVGITPKYRGVHGAYWALTQQDLENCGVTVHLVDKGIDTGGILYQEQIKISDRDNFNTYPYLQYAAAVPLMEAAIRDALADRLQPKVNNLPSKLWYHPTIFEYLKYRKLLGIN